MPFDPSIPFAADNPELGSLRCRFPDAPGGAVELTKFLTYDYEQNFLTPCDAWNFSVPAANLTDAERDAIVPRTRVLLSIDDQSQSVGYIDDVRIHNKRGVGAILRVEGRDWLGPVIDSHIDPQARFTPTMSLQDLLTAVFAPFGVEVVSNDNTANRNAITGGIFGAPVTKTGKPLKSYQLHLEKPYPNEGAFAFAARVAQRFGLWLWGAADGKTVVVGRPTYDQAPRYQLRQALDGSAADNNVEDSDFALSGRDQPSCIVGFGSGGGGEFAKSQLKGLIVNPLIQADIGRVLTAYPTIRAAVLPPDAADIGVTPIVDANARPLFLYDAQAHTQAQLEAFLLRELALRMRKSLTAHYGIIGHRLGGLPVAVDTMVAVDDDVSRLHQALWVLGRRFSRSTESGSRTTLELIRPGTLVFG